MMNFHRSHMIGAAMLVLVVSRATADEASLQLKEGREKALVVSNCSGCHSLDYVVMNSGFMKRAAWEASVRKMVTVMGAPIADADAQGVIDYLAREYGIPD
jgi:mono/diheme cytochrome c family protein